MARGCSLALPSRADPAQAIASGTILPPMIAVRSGFVKLMRRAVSHVQGFNTASAPENLKR